VRWGRAGGRGGGGVGGAAGCGDMGAGAGRGAQGAQGPASGLAPAYAAAWPSAVPTRPGRVDALAAPLACWLRRRHAPALSTAGACGRRAA
jgi:hypothetical protein